MFRVFRKTITLIVIALLCFTYLPAFAASSTDEGVLGNDRWSVTSSGHLTPNANATENIGSSSYRVNAYYGTTINTSGLITGKGMTGGSSALTAGTLVTVNNSLADVFTLMPLQAETILATSLTAGQRVGIVITTTGTSSFALTFGSGFKTTGTLTTGGTNGKVFTINFISDGTNLNEVARTTAM